MYSYFSYSLINFDFFADLGFNFFQGNCKISWFDLFVMFWLRFLMFGWNKRSLNNARAIMCFLMFILHVCQRSTIKEIWSNDKICSFPWIFFIFLFNFFRHHDCVLCTTLKVAFFFSNIFYTTIKIFLL